MVCLEHTDPAEVTTRDAVVVHFTGCTLSFDEEGLDYINEQLFALADEPTESNVLLDFGDVDYLAVAAFGTLVGLNTELLARGRHLTVGGVSPQVHELYRVTGLAEFVDVRSGRQAIEPEARNGQPACPPGVLLVDDEPAVLRLLAARLGTEGYRVWQAEHGRQAIELYRQHREQITAVLLDVWMPGLDGPDILAALKNICPTVHCCFMTGDPAPYTKESLVQTGSVRVFRKPFAFTEVIATINQLASRPHWQHRWVDIPNPRGCLFEGTATPHWQDWGLALSHEIVSETADMHHISTHAVAESAQIQAALRPPQSDTRASGLPRIRSAD